MSDNSLPHQETNKVSHDTLESLRQETERFEKETKLFYEYLSLFHKDGSTHITNSGAQTRGGKYANKARKQTVVIEPSKKLEIANQVNEKLEEMIRFEERKHISEVESIKAMLVQIGIREKEMEKEKTQFNREIIEESTDERTGHIIGERILKWYDDMVKAKEIKKETLKLKRDSMIAKIKTTKDRLKDKRDHGDKLQQVDYDQLKIDHDNYLSDINALSTELGELQKTSSSVVSRLQKARNKLLTQEKECEEMKQSIEQKLKAISKYGKEANDVENDHKKLISNNEDIVTKKSEYRVPDVSDYIDKKARIYEQSKVIKNWERKVQLATMNVKRLQKELEEMDTPRGH